MRYRLDNSGILHLAVLRRDNSNTFRMSVVLDEKIDPAVLQQALDAINGLAAIAQQRPALLEPSGKRVHRHAQAKALADAVVAEFPNTKVTLEPTTALCSFYAEAGGLMIGFEGGYNTNNNNKEF